MNTLCEDDDNTPNFLKELEKLSTQHCICCKHCDPLGYYAVPKNCEETRAMEYIIRQKIQVWQLTE